MTKKLMLGTAMAALMLSGAFAQSTDTKAKPEATPPAATDQSKPADKAMNADKDKATSGDKAALAGDKVVMSQKPDQWLSSKFKGTDVVGADDKKIGDVSDILFDKEGKIEAYVISVGGFLGMGAKDVALAPTSFDVVPGSQGESDKLKLSMTQDQLKEAAEFKPYQPPRPAVTTGTRPGGSPAGMRPPGGAGSPATGR
jgi:sporulation protein YlmC with PRC-barrel domain